jgi:hypothetical protein
MDHVSGHRLAAGQGQRVDAQGRAAGGDPARHLALRGDRATAGQHGGRAGQRGQVGGVGVQGHPALGGQHRGQPQRQARAGHPQRQVGCPGGQLAQRGRRVHVALLEHEARNHPKYALLQWFSI